MKFKNTVFDTALLVLVGLPASGKSTYAIETVNDNLRAQWVSSDNIRIENDYEISNEEVFQEMWRRTKEAARNKKYIIYDATNISSKNRRRLVTNFKKFCGTNGLMCTTEAIVFLQPYNVLIERNDRRSGRACVPKEVIDRMLKQFQFPDYFEGFDNIIVSEKSNGELLPIKDISSMEQDNPHHSLSLGGHLLKTQDYAICGNSSRVVEIASLYHDVGKYWTKTYDKKGIAHYYNHENVGAYMVGLHFLAHGHLEKQMYDVLVLINYHMRPFAWKKSKSAEEKDRERFGETLFRRIKTLHKYDSAAH